MTKTLGNNQQRSVVSTIWTVNFRFVFTYILYSYITNSIQLVFTNQFCNIISVQFVKSRKIKPPPYLPLPGESYRKGTLPIKYRLVRVDKHAEITQVTSRVMSR